MNHIQLAAQHVMDVIPRQVLEIAFHEPDWNRAPTSLMDRITRRVIRGRVMRDINLVSGQHTIVDTSGLPYVRTKRGETIIEIPPNLINNANILSVSQVYTIGIGQYSSGYPDAFGSNGLMPTSTYTQSGGPVVSALNRLMEANTNRPQLSNARCEIVGENVVMIADTYQNEYSYMLECFVTHDPNLNNISLFSNLKFRELVLRAVKAYIYTTLYVALDRGYLEGGQELSAIKTYHESCADAQELYNEYLTTTWARVAAYSNHELHARQIRLQVSPGL